MVGVGYGYQNVAVKTTRQKTKRYGRGRRSRLTNIRYRGNERAVKRVRVVFGERNVILRCIVIRVDLITLHYVRTR